MSWGRYVVIAGSVGLLGRAAVGVVRIASDELMYRAYDVVCWRMPREHAPAAEARPDGG